MKINTYTKEYKPEYISNDAVKASKLLQYLYNTKDENFIKGSIIDRIDIYQDCFVKVYFGNEMMSFDKDRFNTLKSHHFIIAAKYHKEELEKFWNMVKDCIDYFLIEDYEVKSSYHNVDEEVTYDRNFIYVKGKSTNIGFSSEMYKFVKQNKHNWY